MKILFAAAECVPFVKTGGLADVVGSLPSELRKQGIDVRVVLPYYTQIPDSYKQHCQDICHFNVKMGWREVYCGVKSLVYDDVPYYFIDNEEFFGRDGLYGYWDDGERFAFFSMAICEMMEKIDFIPHVIHAHDWHTAMVPVLLVHKYSWINAYRHIRKMLTIHNLKFQGVYPSIVVESLFGMNYDAFHDLGIKYQDDVNFLKGGIHYSDVVTTVSPSYAQEIQTEKFGETLERDLYFNNWKLYGILNGIDTMKYNPVTDPLIHTNFDYKNYSKREKNKKALQKELGLPQNSTTPLIASISRLTDQKGFGIIIDQMYDLLEEDIQYVVLGTGDFSYEETFKYLQETHPDKIAAIIDFDPALAQRIYAGSDMFLMPSQFEPCGLSQLIALRYGSVPIVTETGGLKDTVIPYNEYTQEGTGFSLSIFDGDTLNKIIRYAMNVYKHKPLWKQLVRQGMLQNFSWNQSVKEYIQLYEKLFEGLL